MEESIEEFSLEDIQDLIRSAERTVRSVRDSLRRRDPSPVPPAPVPRMADSDPSEPVDRQAMDSSPSPPSSNNTSGTGSSDSGEHSRPENTDNSSNMGNAGSSSDSDNSASISIEENASGGAPEQIPRNPVNPNVSVDDEVILVSETKNPNPPVIDLCSPDVGAVGGDIPFDPPPRSRRRRRQEPAPEESSPPQRPLFNCVICLSDMSAKRPFSTNCGHVFCENCIKTAIQVSKRCPICRKILNMKSIHPLYLSAN